MNRTEKDGITAFHFTNLSKFSNVKHFISTRIGGFSSDHLNSLNIGLGVEDDPSLVIKNRIRLADIAGISLNDFIFARQVHECNIEVISFIQKGKGAFNREDAIANTDAMITNESGICLSVKIADCVPVLLYDPVQNIIAAVHAGWRGSVKRIAEKTIMCMINNFKCNPDSIIAGIGPSIGPCCYEVGYEVEKEVIKSFGTTEKYIIPSENRNKIIFDLWYTNFAQLINAGLRKKNIEVAGLCTNCHPELFFSSRYTNGKTGRQAAGIMMC